MSNVLTALAPILYSAAQKIPRELTGTLGAVTLNFDDKGVAINDTVKVPIIAQGSASAYTPAMTASAGSDNTPTTATVSITNNQMYTWNVTGEQERSLMNGGDNAAEFMRQNMEQGIRTLVNAIELRTWQAAYQSASRATGTAGTSPFATNITPLANCLQVLLDNGMTDLDNITAVINTTAGANLRGQVLLNGQFPSSTAQDLLNTGVLTVLFGMKVRESGQVAAVTKGTGTSYTTSASANVVGQTVFTGILTGTGTILPGDVITFAGDANNKYMVQSSVGGSTVTSITIGAPGLKVGFTGTNAITVGANYTPNVLIHRKGVVAVIRPPIIPQNPIIQQIPVTDPVTGMTMLFCRVAGDGMLTYRLHVADGEAAVQSNTQAILLG